MASRLWRTIEDLGLTRRGELRTLAERVKHLRRDAGRRQRGRDRAQDERLDALEREVDELRIDLAALASLLIDREVLRAEEVGVIADDAD